MRAHRLRVGMSQEDLARRSGVSVRSIQTLESDPSRSPRPSTVRLLADGLGLGADERAAFVNHYLNGGEEVRAAQGLVPAMLPVDPYGFVGRTEELCRLDRLLAMSTQQPTAVMISAVSGTAGVGKTALAVHWAHRVAHLFPDGQLYVNLRGFGADGQVMAPDEAVRSFLNAFNVAPERMPPSLEAQVGQYRSLLAGKRVLVVLDNARDAEQVRPLLPGTPTALVLVTSRSQLTGLVVEAGAHPITIDLLSNVDARDLLARRLGAERVDTEPEAVEQIINRCARLPLALTVAAARAQQTGFALAAIAAELGEAGGRLDALDIGEPAREVRAVFSWSYRALTPDAARLFRLFGLHPGPDLSVPAAASLAAYPPARVRTLLKEAARANLLTETAPGRYGCHDLLRAYAAELVRCVEPEAERRAASQRLIEHYLHSAYAADRVLAPSRDPIPLAPPLSGVAPERFATGEHTLAWFAAEHAVLVAVIEYAAAAGFDAHVWQLAFCVADFLDRKGHWQDWIDTATAAAAAAERLGDRRVQARAHRLVALACVRLARYDDAHAQLLPAIELGREIGDLAGQGHTHSHASHICDRQGNHAEALAHAQRALELYRAVDHRVGQANALNMVGWCHAQLGEYREALHHCGQALDLLRELDDTATQAVTWDSLGYANRHLDRFTEAVTCYRHAIRLHGISGDRHGEAVALGHLGDTYDAYGRTGQAYEAWRAALDTLAELNHPDADEIRAKLAAAGQH